VFPKKERESFLFKELFGEWRIEFE